MFIKEYIDSGILELYVAGALTEKECQEVYQLMLAHPEIKDEISNIENTILELTSATSPGGSKHNFGSIKKDIHLEKEKIRIDNEKAEAEAEKEKIKEKIRVEKEKIKIDKEVPKIVSLNKKSKINWFGYTSWVATILFGAGLIWLGNENNDLTNEKNQLNDEIDQLKTKVNSNDSDKKFLELEIEKININLEASKKLISIFRDRTIISVSLAGQTIAPKAYAKVYWDKKNKTIYLDAQGLPKPPEGKVYQLWSLTLDPFTSKSLGTLDDFNSVDDKIFTIQNPNASQAFGITLEPAEGSSTPTLNQLYTLGIV
tara:strand:+ start:4464 stop:5405 length:942 start_codon:yes stop_codon:yes gene_type:complete